MRCRRCHTEIADNALLCYRCGTAVEPETPTATASGRTASRRRWVWVVGAAILSLLGLLAWVVV